MIRNVVFSIMGYIYIYLYIDHLACSYYFCLHSQFILVYLAIGNVYFSRKTVCLLIMKNSFVRVTQSLSIFSCPFGFCCLISH